MFDVRLEGGTLRIFPFALATCISILLRSGSPQGLRPCRRNFTSENYALLMKISLLASIFKELHKKTSAIGSTNRSRATGNYTYCWSLCLVASNMPRPQFHEDKAYSIGCLGRFCQEGLRYYDGVYLNLYFTINVNSEL